MARFEPETSALASAGAPPSAPRKFRSPRPFTLAVIACALTAAFLANFPAIETPHAGLAEETYGRHFGIVGQLEHGWPLRYVRRSPPAHGATDEPLSPWRPWQEVQSLSLASLALDLVLWTAIVVAIAAATHYWRSRRWAIWQLDLRDLLLLTGALAAAFAWLAATRADRLREQTLLAEFRQRNGNPQMQHEVATSVPAWWPDTLQGHWRQAFDRTSYYRSSGDTDLASQHRHVLTLRETAFHRDFPKHLRQMPGLEALDLSYTRLPYFDATGQATILRDLAPLANLRGINLYGTNATDADMAWLAACRNLEMIDLSGTRIGDHGLKQLAALPRLRTLVIDSNRISDDGCRSIARLGSLEELSLASRNIHDQGALALASLTGLRRLKISAAAGDAAFAALREQLPRCEVKAHAY
ncbi:MAG TPA: hypothetical protein VFV87_16975 [Pirellulaceae bacterium]|nr:hypothetical protein [Pirellulaceae bacterium]